MAILKSRVILLLTQTNKECELLGRTLKVVPLCYLAAANLFGITNFSITAALAQRDVQ